MTRTSTNPHIYSQINFGAPLSRQPKAIPKKVFFPVMFFTDPVQSL
ncbi:MAG: hypothetical protein ACXWEY_04245 [Bacteroidia bacterium]